MATLASGYLQKQVATIRQQEIAARIAQLRQEPLCPKRLITEGTVQSIAPISSTQYIHNKVNACQVKGTISPGGTEAGIWLRNKQLDCVANEATPIQVQRVPARIQCQPLPPETRNAGMPIPTPLFPCVPQIVGFNK